MNHSLLKVSLVRVAGVLLLLTFSGCGQSIVEEATEAAIEAGMPDGSKVEINEAGGSVNIETPEGSVKLQTGESVTLPDNFPTDIFIPDGITWQMAQSSKADDKDIIIVQGTLDSPMETVASSVREKLAGDGWESTSTFTQTGEMEMLTFKKGERELNVSITKDNDKTALLYSLQ